MSQDSVKQLIVARAAFLGTTLKALSLQLNRNAAYLQQFVKQGKPKKLDEDDRIALAKLLKVDETLLRGTGKGALKPEEKHKKTPSEGSASAKQSIVNQSTDMLSSQNENETESYVAPAPDLPVPSPWTSMPKDVPVLGTAECGPNGVFEMNGGGAIDYVRRPDGQRGNKRLFAVYARGDSMKPMFHNSDPVYVDPNRPPEQDRAVLVEFHPVDHENPRAVIKVLSRITAEFVEVYQLNPNNIDKPVRYSRKTVKAIYRVLSNQDMMGV